MADLTQSSSTTATTAPKFYTDYITDLATKGTAAGAAVPTAAWDPTALQTKAFTDVASNVGNYKPGLTTAGETFTKAGATDITGATDPYLTAGTTTSGLSAANPYLTSGASGTADLVGGYMNPYTRSVVDQIRLANQQNIQQNLSPGITAGAVGGGQFGSSRGANALALGLSNANIGALGLQSKALQEGYSDAMKQAMQQRINELTAGKTAGDLQTAYNTAQIQAGQIAGRAAADEGQLLRDVATGQAKLADQLQSAGLADVNALATLGEQQQKIAQNKAMMPLDVLSKQGALMSGVQLPMTTTQTMSGSPLSLIAGLGSLGLGAFTSKDGKSPFENAANFLKNLGVGTGSFKMNPDGSADLGGGIRMNPDGTMVDLSSGGATGAGGGSSGDWQQDENGEWYDAGIEPAPSSNLPTDELPPGYDYGGGGTDYNYPDIPTDDYDYDYSYYE